MAEQPALETDHAETQEQQASDPSDTVDYFLQSLVNLANDNFEIGVTLNIGGFLLSGTIVGGKRYFDEYLAGPGFADELPEASRVSVQEYFRSFGKIYDSIPDQVLNQPAFIHLRDARFFHHAGKPIPANRPVWWRGRISEVQGFSLGVLSNESAS